MNAKKKSEKKKYDEDDDWDEDDEDYDEDDEDYDEDWEDYDDFERDYWKTTRLTLLNYPISSYSMKIYKLTDFFLILCIYHILKTNDSTPLDKNLVSLININDPIDIAKVIKVCE